MRIEFQSALYESKCKKSIKKKKTLARRKNRPKSIKFYKKYKKKKDFGAEKKLSKSIKFYKMYKKKKTSAQRKNCPSL